MRDHHESDGVPVHLMFDVSDEDTQVATSEEFSDEAPTIRVGASDFAHEEPTPVVAIPTSSEIVAQYERDWAAQAAALAAIPTCQRPTRNIRPLRKAAP